MLIPSVFEICKNQVSKMNRRKTRKIIEEELKRMSCFFLPRRLRSWVQSFPAVCCPSAGHGARRQRSPHRQRGHTPPAPKRRLPASSCTGGTSPRPRRRGSAPSRRSAESAAASTASRSAFLRRFKKISEEVIQGRKKRVVISRE